MTNETGAVPVQEFLACAHMVPAPSVPGKIGCLTPAVVVSFERVNEVDTGGRVECFLHWLETRNLPNGQQRVAYWLDLEGTLGEMAK